MTYMRKSLINTSSTILRYIFHHLTMSACCIESCNPAFITKSTSVHTISSKLHSKLLIRLHSTSRLLCAHYHSLQWRHNKYAGVSNHQPQVCLFNRLFKTQIKEKHQSSVSGEDRWTPHTKENQQSMSTLSSKSIRLHLFKYVVPERFKVFEENLST